MAEATPSFRFVHTGEQSGTQIQVKRQNKIATKETHSHAIREGFRNKRKQQQLQLKNFRPFTTIPPKRPSRRRDAVSKVDEKRYLLSTNMVLSISEGYLDPFNSLPVSSKRLQHLLNQPTSRQAVEPVFSLNDRSFQSYHEVFCTGLADVALANALALALLSASEAGRIQSPEATLYSTTAIREISRSLNQPLLATTPATLGAILLLVGVDYRAGRKREAQTHLEGIQQIIEYGNAQGISVADSIMRVVFWQDLNSAVISGSNRVFTYCSFSNLQHSPSTVLPKVPGGFERHEDLLSEPFLVLAQNIRQFQEAIISRVGDPTDSSSLLELDNYQAYLESAIFQQKQDLLVQNGSPTLDACLMAAYIFTYMLHADIWQASLVPSYWSNKLLDCLQRSKPYYTEATDLFLWLVVIGGSLLASEDPIKAEFAALVKDMYPHDEVMAEIGLIDDMEHKMQDFLWAPGKFGEQCKMYYQMYLIEG